MTLKEKLIKRIKSKLKDFTWDELTSLLNKLNFSEVKSKNRGYRSKSIGDNNIVITLHKPHHSNILKKYPLEQIIEILS